MVGVVHCHRSSSSSTPKLGSMKAMEEPSFCNLSLAVDCTLSLGSTTTTSRTDAPVRLSRVGSPDPDLALSLSVRSERAVEPSRRTSELEQDMSWGGSCTRSDPDASPECYPQVSERGVRASDGGRKGFKAWPRSSYRDEVKTSKALFGMIEEQGYSNRSSHQAWLPNYLPSSAVNTVEQCMEDGDNGARACAHCGTSKTPLWRNGPGGPKSLCNACGIRFKKAGRRSAANGTAESPVSPPATTEALKRKLPSEESHDWVFPADAKPRKRSRGNLLHRMSESSLPGSCMTWQPWSPPKSPLHRASPLSPSDDAKVPSLDAESFSSDEEEGAVLLMALSCGMVNA